MIAGIWEIIRVFIISIFVSIKFLFSRENSGSRDARLGAYVFALVRALGPMYTKIAQILTAQSGYLSASFREALHGVFDRNESVSFDVVRGLIERAYGCPIETSFASFDQKPLGSGSVAQVHSATLKTGEQVAVKIIKPGSVESLRSALGAAAVILRLTERLFSTLRPLRLTENFADIRESLFHQTDLGAEYQNQLAFVENFVGHPFITIPNLYHSMCTKDIIVMDYIDGSPVYDCNFVTIDRKMFAESIQNAFYTMLFIHGHFHVDPHPGNMLVLPGGRLALLDFGMVAQISEKERIDFAGFYFACIKEELADAATRFTELFVEQAEKLQSDHQFAAQLSQILKVHFRDRTDRWSTMGFVTDAAYLMRERGVRMKPGMALLILCVVTGEGVLVDTDPEIDIWQNAKTFVDKATAMRQ